MAITARYSSGLPLWPCLACYAAANVRQFWPLARPSRWFSSSAVFCTLVCLTGVVWGMGALLLMNGVSFEHQFLSFNVGVSIGLVALVSPHSTAAGVMKAADATCYAAKKLGRGRVNQFDPDDADLNRHRQQVDSVAVIYRTLERSRFELHAQAMRAARSSADEAPSHLEILVRMRDDRGATIASGLLLPAAERYGLAPRIDRWVIKHTCQWFGAHQLSATKFCFEITETAAIASITSAQKFIGELQQRGFSFAVDDFGSGLSSFAYLKTLPVDVIKTDGILVRNIAVDRLDEAMVRSIAEVARIMDKVTLAAFVEGPQQAEVLTRLGIDYLQSYGIGKSVPSGELSEDIKSYAHEPAGIAL